MLAVDRRGEAGDEVALCEGGADEAHKWMFRVLGETTSIERGRGRDRDQGQELIESTITYHTESGQVQRSEVYNYRPGPFGNPKSNTRTDQAVGGSEKST